jgi:outer membrane protein TolC
MVTLERHPAARSADARVAAADARVVAGEHAHDPVWHTTLGWQSNEVSLGTSSVNGGGGPWTTAGVSLPLITGGHAELEVGASIAPIDRVTQKWLSSARPIARVVLTQPVMRGLGNGPQRVEQRRALAARQISCAASAHLRMQLAVSAARTWWDVLLATAELEVRRVALAGAEEQRRASRAAVDVGRLADSALGEVEVAVSLREEEVLLAERELRERQRQLAVFVGAPVDPTAPVALAPPSATAPIDDSDERLVARAMKESTRVHAARADEQIGRLEALLAADDELPAVDVSLSAAMAGAPPTVASGWHADALDTPRVDAGIAFTWSAPARNSSLAAAARLEARAAHLAVAEEENSVRAGVRSALDRLRTARARLDVTTRAAALARQDLAAEAARFAAGRSANFEVLRRQDEVASADLRSVRAQVDHGQGAVDLDALTGALLPGAGAAPGCADLDEEAP